MLIFDSPLIRMSQLTTFEKAETEIIHAVMSAVMYFDIFCHPLRAHELLHLVHYKSLTEKELITTLDHLIHLGFLHKKDGYYLPHDKFENINRRLAGEKLAEISWEIASRKAELIGSFPFVRCVIITGSLSKNFMDENSDIDYLIITKPGRLWIARTLLILYKKAVLFNSRKHFCVNYFLDTDHMQLKDHNVFTATELLFATPLYNSRMYNELLSANSWVLNYLPAFGSRKNAIVSGTEKNGTLKTITEFLLGGKVGEWLNHLCMTLFTKWWDRKFRRMDPVRYQRDMRSEKGISKHHPNNFRDKILNAHKSKVEQFFEEYSLKSESVAQKNHEVIS